MDIGGAAAGTVIATGLVWDGSCTLEVVRGEGVTGEGAAENEALNETLLVVVGGGVKRLDRVTGGPALLK